jgi:hypothetical protein
MTSTVAGELARNRRIRLAAMSPAERIRLAERLGNEGVASFMITQGIDRRTAIARIKATRRFGRRHSPCAVADEY